MTADQKKEMLGAFNEIDTNKDGFIQRGELRSFFLNRGISDEEQLSVVVDDIYEQIDEDEDGTISVEEFVNKFMEMRVRLED